MSEAPPAVAYQPRWRHRPWVDVLAAAVVLAAPALAILWASVDQLGLAPSMSDLPRFMILHAAMVGFLPAAWWWARVAPTLGRLMEATFRHDMSLALTPPGEILRGEVLARARWALMPLVAHIVVMVVGAVWETQRDRGDDLRWRMTLLCSLFAVFMALLILGAACVLAVMTLARLRSGGAARINSGWAHYIVACVVMGLLNYGTAPSFLLVLFGSEHIAKMVTNGKERDAATALVMAVISLAYAGGVAVCLVSGVRGALMGFARLYLTSSHEASASHHDDVSESPEDPAINADTRPVFVVSLGAAVASALVVAALLSFGSRLLDLVLAPLLVVAAVLLTIGLAALRIVAARLVAAPAGTVSARGAAWRALVALSPLVMALGAIVAVPAIVAFDDFVLHSRTARPFAWSVSIGTSTTVLLAMLAAATTAMVESIIAPEALSLKRTPSARFRVFAHRWLVMAIAGWTLGVIGLVPYLDRSDFPDWGAGSADDSAPQLLASAVVLVLALAGFVVVARWWARAWGRRGARSTF